MAVDLKDKIAPLTPQNFTYEPIGPDGKTIGNHLGGQAAPITLTEFD